MNKILLGITLSLLVTDPAFAMFKDDPLLTKFASEFEYHEEEGIGELEWDIDFWRGKDLTKFWIKSSGELEQNESADANIEFVYSRAVHPYWDRQFGVRFDIESDSSLTQRQWLSFGFIGTAPYFVNVDARLFVGEQSSSQIVIELERELMLSQEWVLTPEMDIVLNGRTNEDYQEGAGLAEIEFGLKLGYEHNRNRKFQPFLGLSSTTYFGRSKDFQKAEGHSSSEVNFKIGLHAWF